MIDIHCHLLPGIDDGAETLEQSIKMAHFAVFNGITHSVITPHIHPGRYENDITSIKKAFLLLQQALTEQNIPLKIAFAAEVRISIEMMSMIEKHSIPYLGRFQDKDLLLLEMPHSHILPGSNKLIDWLFKRNIQPVIAHPERNKELMNDFSKVIPLIEQGCWFQLTAASVAGKFGPLCQDLSRYLVENNLVSFIATDAHNLQFRPPDLQQAVSFISRWANEEKAHDLVNNTAWQVVKEKF